MLRGLTRRAFIGTIGASGILGRNRVRGVSDGHRAAGDRAPSGQSTPTQEWDLTYGSQYHDYAADIIATTDGEYLFCGTAESQYGTGKAWLVKIRPDGTDRWQRTYGEAGEANAVVEAPDGGYVFAGIRGGKDGEDAWLQKVSRDGRPMWAETYGGSGHDRARGLTGTRDGGYVLAGGLAADGSEDAWLLKAGADGTEQWSRSFGGSGDDWANDVIETSDGEYVLAGRKAVGGPQAAFLVKVAPDGTEQWQGTYGGAGDAGAASVIEAADGRYVFPGKTRPGVSYDGWLVTVGRDGTQADRWTFGTDLDDTAEAVIETADGGFLFEGATEVEDGGIEDLWLGKVAADGAVEWTQTYGTPRDDYSLSFTATHDDGLLLLGNTTIAGTNSAWLVKLRTPGLTPVTPPTPRPSTPTATATSTRSPKTSRATATSTHRTTRRRTTAAEAGATTARSGGFGLLAALGGLAGAASLGWRRRTDGRD